jgi:O-antigen ligase
MKTVTSERKNQATKEAPFEESAPLALGFSSLFGLLGFATLCLLLLVAPFYFSSFPEAEVRGSVESGVAYVPPMMFASVTAISCLLLALSGESTPRSRLCFLVFALGVWCGLSFFGAVYKHDAALEIARIFACLAWFFIARTLLSSAQENDAMRRHFWIIAAIVAGAVVVCGLALFHPKWGFFKDPNFRQFSTFFNPNLLANYCAMALPLALSLLFLRRGKFLSFLSLVAALIIFGGLASTRSKGGLLALAIALLVFALAVFKARGPLIKNMLRAHKKLAIISALLLLILGGALVQKTVVPRLMAANSGEDNSTQFRLYTWQGTTHMIAARPVFGWGPGCYSSAYPQFAITGFTLTAHQVWLQLASESGVIAALLLLAACGAAALKGWRALATEHWPLAAGGLASLAAFFVHGLTDAGWSLISIALLLMIVLALLGSLPEEKNRQLSLGTRHSSLSYSWLLASLLFGLFAMGHSRVVEAESLAAQSRESLGKGLPQVAEQQAIQATETDPYNARVWHNAGRVLESVKPSISDSYLSRALELQPTKAAHHLTLVEASKGHIEATGIYDRAVELDPNDTRTRLARADYLLSLDEKSKQRGWQDYEYVAALYDAPYGKYPAIAEIVNFDFVKAFVKLAERALAQKDKTKAQKLIEKAEAVLAVWKANATRNGDIARESGTLENFERQENLAQELEAQVNSLKERMKGKQ